MVGAIKVPAMVEIASVRAVANVMNVRVPRAVTKVARNASAPPKPPRVAPNAASPARNAPANHVANGLLLNVPRPRRTVLPLSVPVQNAAKRANRAVPAANVMIENHAPAAMMIANSQRVPLLASPAVCLDHDG